jgi:3',5'-cyclic-nucleotide phosphodiesterase
LELEAQCELEACVVSHAHLDHIRDLATIADNRCQAECEPLLIAATRPTIRILRKHFFNNQIWPDFSEIHTSAGPTIRFIELKSGQTTKIAGYEVMAIPVSHTIDSSGFVVRGPGATLGYSGDTGPTEQLWKVLKAEPKLKALLMEVSFPNREQQLASDSGHHTPKTLGKDLKKFGKPQDLPTLLYHIKPVFQGEVEQECARLKGVNLTVTALGDQFAYCGNVV